MCSPVERYSCVYLSEYRNTCNIEQSDTFRLIMCEREAAGYILYMVAAHCHRGLYI